MLRPGPVTFARLAEGRGDYHLNYALGEGLAGQLRRPHPRPFSVRLEGDPERLLASLASQHFAIAYGTLALDLGTLAHLLGRGDDESIAGEGGRIVDEDYCG